MWTSFGNPFFWPTVLDFSVHVILGLRCLWQWDRIGGNTEWAVGYLGLEVNLVFKIITHFYVETNVKSAITHPPIFGFAKFCEGSNPYSNTTY